MEYNFNLFGEKKNTCLSCSDGAGGKHDWRVLEYQFKQVKE